MVPKVAPHDGEPSDYELPAIGDEVDYEEFFETLIVAALPALIAVFYSDTDRGKQFRGCDLCEHMGEESYIGFLAISQATATLNQMRNPSA